MSNVGFGARLHKAQYDPSELVTCIHLSGDSVLLGKGDVVKIVTGSTKIGQGPIVQAVARQASGSPVYGVVVGCNQVEVSNTNFNLSNTYCPASTAMYLLVKPIKPGEVYEMQEDGQSGSVATTNVGKNANMVVANASTVTGMSGTMLQSSSAATTNTLDLNIVGFRDYPSDTPGTNAVILVTFNNLQVVSQTTGV